MPFPTPASPFHLLPISKVTLPKTPLTSAALTFLTENTRPSTVNHCLRSAAFALLLTPRLPQLASIQDTLDTELIVVSVMLHDMGWATNPELLSTDKRFEVDGAEIARGFVTKETGWDKHKLQLLWDAIALHTTPSIAMFKEAEVVAAHLGITADFLGAYLGVEEGGGPGPLVSVDEYKEIVTAFPREGFKDDLVLIMCGLCKSKPDTTYVNFVGEFGLELGLDGKGEGKDEYRKAWESHRVLPMLMASLDRNVEFE